MKHNNGKNRDSDRQQITKQIKFADREYFATGRKNRRRPRYLS